ncbi:MAG: hypothetical protein JSR86_06280 [Proteobacteria bacterium]|nr:hypothetical protein [Pseudomonadota bacterium]
MSAAAVGFAREALLAGDPASALGMLRSQASGGSEVQYWTASALMALGDTAAAGAALDAARTAQTLETIVGMGADIPRLSTDPDYAAQVATKLYAGQNVAMSSAVWDLAVKAGHQSASGWLTHGLALQHQGRAREAITVMRGALERWPSPALHQFMLYPHLLLDDRGQGYAAEARRWAQIHAPAPAASRPLSRRPLAGRKLRVGYVSPSFARTQIHQFIAPVLEAHDRDAVELFLYPAKADGEAIWPQPTTIRPIGDLGDEAAANLIAADEIDVLVDCWGHSAGSRLSLFARRCAPVQAGWINFIQTTGLPQMDYVLHADSPGQAPGGAAALEEPFSEAVWPIGPVFNVFRPAEGRLPPVPSPALTTGQMTFGSFNHPCKLTDATVAAWAAILKAVPSARLVLKYGYYADPVLRRATQARFAGHGVSPDRIQFRGHSTGEDYYKAFHEIDLALDPWPSPGSTTTLEALSNGVPVLSLAGPGHTAGVVYASSILRAAGLDALNCADPDAYVRAAADLARDLPALNALRARVRAGFEASAICDGPGFTRRIEAAFAEMAARAEARAAAA